MNRAEALRAAAIHEAGHFIVGKVLGFPTPVYVRAELSTQLAPGVWKTGGGRTEWRRDPEPNLPAFEYVVSAHAGLEAERAFGATIITRGRMPNGEPSDEEQIAALLKLLPDWVGPVACPMAKALVTSHRERIARFAEQLEATGGYLDREAIDKLAP